MIEDLNLVRRTVHPANRLIFGTLIATLLLIGVVIWNSFDAARGARIWSQHSFAVLQALDELDLSVRDAETGQRGYLLTGRENYLQPYTQSLGQIILLEGTLEKLTGGDQLQQQLLHALAPLLQSKLDELAETMEMRREFGLNAALPLVNTDLGLKTMTQIEATIAAMSASERQAMGSHIGVLNRRALWVRVLVLVGMVLSILSLVLAAWMLNQAWRKSCGIEQRQRNLIIRLRTTLDSLSEGVGVFDAEARLTNWNEKFHTLLGLPDAVVRLRTPYDVFAQGAAARGIVMEAVDHVLAHPKATRGTGLHESTRDDGRLLELRRTHMPEGGFVLTISDMTERIQAEGVQREAQKMEAIGQLTGGIAHDFNNLLTVILGNLEVVRRGLEAEPGLQTRIDRGISAAQRGATLTSQLLSFARKQPLAPAPIDLIAVMADLVPLLRRTLGEHIEIRYTKSEGLWSAMADAAQLESALRNLALNARDAMPRGGRLSIEISNHVLGDEEAPASADVSLGDYIMLAVSDTGHGMAPEIVHQAFEPFFTTKLIGKGSGLGLAMVFGFVKQSGGHVEIHSELSVGTTVRLYLPRAMTEAVGSRLGGSPVPLPRGSGTILVVEDEAAVREIAVTTLRDLGYRVFEAGDAEEAMQSYELLGSDLDLLLTDVVLPGSIRGRDIAERIAATRTGVPTLFMSGFTDNSIIQPRQLDGSMQFIGKPFTQEQLARTVANMLGPVDTGLKSDSTASDNVIGFRGRVDE